MEGPGHDRSRRPSWRRRTDISAAALRVKVSASTWLGSASPVGGAVGDPPGQHPGLARAGPGQDDQWGGPAGHGATLGIGQPLEELSRKRCIDHLFDPMKGV